MTRGELIEEIDRLRVVIDACDGSCKARLSIDQIYAGSDLLREYPVSEMMERGWLPECDPDSVTEVEQSLCRFLGVQWPASAAEARDHFLDSWGMT